MTSKDREILTAMKKQYGDKRGKSVFYASATAGKLGRDVQQRHGAQNRGKKHAN